MNTQILTGDDTRFLAQQPEYEVNIMLGQMTTLMQNITSLQNDTDDKVAKLESQNWFKKMTNTLFGKNKATRQEIQKNNDKVVTYISQSVAQLYNMNMINERVISSLGNRMNEVYAQTVEMNQEMLNMKGQISQIMAVQQQTLESMGAFVGKLNEKIESVDNFHMLISEIQNGMYNDSSKLYNICLILSQLDKRQMDDNRKMNLLNDTMIKSNIITQDEFSVLQCLQEIVALPQEKIGLIYLELCNFRNSFPANLFADMIEGYHFLSKMEKMSKKKEVIIQRVLDKYELDADAAFSIADISESFFENKQACLVSFIGLETGTDSTYQTEDSVSVEKQQETNSRNIPNDTLEETVSVTQDSTNTSSKLDFSKLNVGDEFEFGIYTDKYNGQKIIMQWKVIKKESKSLYVLCKHGVGSSCIKYTTNDNSNSWIDSGLRKELNDEFYLNSFTEEEKSFIMTKNSDYVTLITKEEAETLLTHEDRKIGYGCWWLRSSFPCSLENQMYKVTAKGGINHGVVNEFNTVRPALYIKI